MFAKRGGNGLGELPEREGKTEEISPEVLEVVAGEVEAGLLGAVGRIILGQRKLGRAKRNIITSVIDRHGKDLHSRTSTIKLASPEDSQLSARSLCLQVDMNTTIQRFFSGLTCFWVAR